jgi:tetratricopeptide (TPR) repeat protein
VLHHQDRHEDAERAIREAIALEPGSPDSFARLAAIHVSRRRWQEALAAAEQGLSIDPQDVDCTNLRAISLVQLGRRSEAGAAIDAALQRDPDNSVTHANKGWALLHSGDPRQALEHFRESLRIDPGNEWARAGIVEALKARNWLYRLMLAYFLWMSRLSGKAQLGLIVGLYIANRAIRVIGQQNPALQPYLQPLLIAYLAFVALTWLASPLFDLLLRLNRFGRLALSERQIRASTWVGLLLAGAILSLALLLVVDQTWSLLIGVYCLGLVIPVNVLVSEEPSKRLRSISLYVWALVLLGPIAFITIIINPTVGGPLGGLFVLAAIAFTWVVAIAQARRA